MASKAAFSGHCQACGHLQKLPNGVLAQHGYKVTHGFFSGVCQGSKSLPFEQSCDLVKTFIARAKNQLKATEKRQNELRQPAQEAKAWISVYHPATWELRHSYYSWESQTVEGTWKAYDGGGYMTYKLNGKESRIDGVSTYEYKGKTPEQLTLLTCQKLNSLYADSMNKEVKNLKNYIVWQTERVSSWKPASLFPVTHKDKLGFVPTE